MTEDIEARLMRLAEEMFLRGSWGPELETIKDAITIISDLRESLRIVELNEE